MQGQLLDEKPKYLITTECGHCQQVINIEMDSDLNYRVLERDAEPMIYVPLVDFGELDDPSIIDAF